MILTKILSNFTGAVPSTCAQDENRCFPCGMVVDKEIIAKICSLIRGIERQGYLSSWFVGWWLSSNTGSSDHSHQKGRLAVVLLHLQAGILGKAVGSAIAPPYLLCRSRATLWLAWAILGIASRPFAEALCV